MKIYVLFLAIMMVMASVFMTSSLAEAKPGSHIPNVSRKNGASFSSLKKALSKNKKNLD